MLEGMNTYRLTSLEEPTDEQLLALMDGFMDTVRQNQQPVKAEHERRMGLLRQDIQRKRVAHLQANAQ